MKTTSVVLCLFNLRNFMTKRAFGELELAILSILKANKRMTVKEVHHIIGEQNKYNTIMTVMVRLTQKKVLARERVGSQYEYWLLSSDVSASSFLEQFKKKFFGVKSSEAVSYLIESGEVSDEELEEMEQMLQEIKKRKKIKSGSK